VELLSEVVQSCSLSEAEIEQQRGVVLRELEEIEGNLQEVCLDLLHATAFQGTPLGQSVLGPSNNARQEELHTHTHTHTRILESRNLHTPHVMTLLLPSKEAQQQFDTMSL